jgi:hypothetical protein
MKWNLNMVLICFSFMARDVEPFFMYFWQFGLPLKNLCSVHLPTASLGHWFLGSLVFWAPCVIWLLIPCQMYRWQRFPHSMDHPFSLLTISFFVSKLCDLPITSLSGETLELHLGIYCCTYNFHCIPCFFLCWLQSPPLNDISWGIMF